MRTLSINNRQEEVSFSILDIICDGEWVWIAIFCVSCEYVWRVVILVRANLQRRRRNLKGYIAECTKTLKRHFECSLLADETVVAANYTEFGAMHHRGCAVSCGRHCRFCMAGYCFVYRAYDLRNIKEGVNGRNSVKVGLMGNAIRGR